MTVCLPKGVKPVKMSKESLPKIPILVNKKDVPENTLLIAIEDPIIAKARELEKEALAAAQPLKNEDNHWPNPGHLAE